MPWQNNNGGGWKSGGSGGGGGGPWGQGPQGPRGGGSNQPDLEEIFKRGQDHLKNAMPGGTGIPTAVWVLLFAIGMGVVGFYAFTYKVNPNQLGIVLRFGEYVDQTGPGLHFRWPYPINEVLLPDVTRNNRIQIGLRSTTGGGTRVQAVRDVPEESLMLTGDENIVDVDFEVQWKIKDARNFLFNIQNAESTVKEVSEAAMREIVGQNDIQRILTEAREEVKRKVFSLIQKTLDEYNAGIEIVQVQLQKVDPPGKVIGAFRDVQAARADQERLQNEANAYANRIVPEARGQAERILQAAQGYRQQTVSEATGQADRFNKIYGEYQKAPDVTRRRMYLETMERVYEGTDKIIMDNKGGSSVVPYLNVDELTKSRAKKAGQ
ncbi:MAG: FtsH protease activity modulator HflK [Alphaproteobacteria bacterium]|nr:FtsH protease activity modulator HflK [Alphaproteobacteria bacterium]